MTTRRAAYGAPARDGRPPLASVARRYTRIVGGYTMVHLVYHDGTRSTTWLDRRGRRWFPPAAIE